MGILSEPFRTEVEYEGERYSTNAAFNTVLAIQAMYKDEHLVNEEKCFLALSNLVEIDPRVLARKPISWQAGLLDAVYKSQIEIPDRPGRKTGPRVLDFELDGEYIYASFYQDYGIDLIEQQGKLHWKKFIWLFQGLSPETKIKEVMKIRSMEEPMPNRHNAKEIQNIRELKSYYALPADGIGGQEGLDHLFASLEAQASGKGVRR